MSDVAASLARLRDDVREIRLELDVPGAAEARRVRDDLAAQIDDYLLPRLRQMDAPALMVVGGSTGAGKSTLVNSLVGAEVSRPGVLRPTTRGPVLACHPDDVRWFEDDRVLPGLPRVSGAGDPAPGSLALVPAPSLPVGLALLDSPDIDSVRQEHRLLATQLLAAADGWLFVTTAARYADAVPWEFLRAARERGTTVSVILNRVPADAGPVVPGDLRRLLDAGGLPEADVLVVPESRLVEGRLAPADLAPVRRWLDDLAADAQARAALVRRTLRGALASLPARAAVVERAVVDQLAVAADLRAASDAAYAAALREVEAALRGGSLLRGEVLARWHEVVGTGDLMRGLESRIGRLRDRVRGLVAGAPADGSELRAAVEGRLEAVILAAAEGAAERTARAWRDRLPGKALLDRSPDLERASAALEPATAETVRSWQAGVLDLVRVEGASRRTTARLASLGVNGGGLTVMLAVFAHTGGLTGAEVAVAGGTSAVGQKVLEAIFGDQAVRTLAARAREDLVERVDRLLRDEAARFDALLDGATPEADAFARLHGTVDAIRRGA